MLNDLFGGGYRFFGMMRPSGLLAQTNIEYGPNQLG